MSRHTHDSADSDKENIPIKCSHGHSCLQQMLEKHQDEDERLLQEVRVQEDEQQKEIVGGLDKLTGSITALGDLHKAQMEQEAQRQMEERNRESQMFELMKMISITLPLHPAAPLLLPPLQPHPTLNLNTVCPALHRLLDPL
ncbi:hypothetical protein M422DRAFT_239037 [Sphaerobolus stellatus SS14]|nr:hypothetical protein M422DRAFT_239037 [Sphaerobolus stellatus SS14]